MTRSYRSEEFLREQYHDMGKSMQQIADECEVSPATIYRWIDRHDLDRRNWGSPPEDRSYMDESWLREKYLDEELSTQEVADLCDTSKETIRRWIDRHEIEKRSHSEACRNAMLKDEYRLRIASENLEGNRRNSWDVWTEEEREAFRRRLSEERTGEGNPMYGVTGEDHHNHSPDTVYPTFYHTPRWRRVRKYTLRRDGHACRTCGSDEKLHVHHITPVSKGGTKFDMENLLTVCEDCHYAIYHSGGTDV